MNLVMKKAETQANVVTLKRSWFVSRANAKQQVVNKRESHVIIPILVSRD